MSAAQDSNSQTNELPSTFAENITPSKLEAGELIETKTTIVPSESNQQIPNQKTATSDSDISNSEKQDKTSTETSSAEAKDIGSLIINAMNQAAGTLKNINIIKDELCKLPIDICETEYINNSILPMLSILNQLSNVIYSLSNSANTLNLSPLVHADRSELKDAVHLCYKIIDQAEDVYEVLRKRINLVIKKN